MFLPLLLLYLYGIVSCEELSGGSICPIGPDTFGLLAEYRDVLLQAPSNNDGTIKVGEYLQNKEQCQRIVDKILTKYKEVQATLVSTSIFYYNYRHAGNLYAMAYSLQRLGLLSRHNMVSMVSEPCLCHPTNSFPGRAYVTKSVDMHAYKGEIANDENNLFVEEMYTPYRSIGMRLHHLRYIMTQRFPKKYPRSSRVATRYRVELDSVGSQVDLPTNLIYMTGHGGDSYFQFQAKDVVSAMDIELYMKEFYIKHPNVHTLFIIDTCQASTMVEKLSQEPPLAWVASSPRGISSYSYNSNMQLTVAVVGKFTFYVTGFIKSVIQGIKERNDRAAISRFSLSQLQRHMIRHCAEESPVFHANPQILRDGEMMIDNGLRQSSAGKAKGKNEPDMKSLYLGSFLFNYRMAYFIDYRWPVNPDTESISEITEQGMPYQSFIVDNEVLRELEQEKLIARMRRSGLLPYVVPATPYWLVAAMILFFALSVGLVILQNRMEITCTCV